MKLMGFLKKIVFPLLFLIFLVNFLCADDYINSSSITLIPNNYVIFEKVGENSSNNEKNSYIFPNEITLIPNNYVIFEKVGENSSNNEKNSYIFPNEITLIPNNYVIFENLFSPVTQQNSSENSTTYNFNGSVFLFVQNYTQNESVMNLKIAPNIEVLLENVNSSKQNTNSSLIKYKDTKNLPSLPISQNLEILAENVNFSKENTNNSLVKYKDIKNLPSLPISQNLEVLAENVNLSEENTNNSLIKYKDTKNLPSLPISQNLEILAENVNFSKENTNNSLVKYKDIKNLPSLPISQNLEVLAENVNLSEENTNNSLIKYKDTKNLPSLPISQNLEILAENVNFNFSKENTNSSLISYVNTLALPSLPVSSNIQTILEFLNWTADLSNFKKVKELKVFVISVKDKLVQIRVNTTDVNNTNYLFIDWGDGNNETVDLPTNSYLEINHTYPNYGNYSLKAEEKNDQGLTLQEWTALIKLREFNIITHSYSYSVDQDLVTNLSLTLNQITYTEVDNYTFNFCYNITDNEGNVIKEEQLLNEIFLRDSGDTFKWSKNLSIECLVEGNYTFNYKVEEINDSYINSPFVALGSFVLDIQANSQGGGETQNNGSGNESSGLGSGNNTYEIPVNFSSSTGYTYRYTTLYNINPEDLESRNLSLFTEGIQAVTTDALPSFLEMIAKLIVTWEGIGLIISVILLFTLGIGFIKLIVGFMIIWELLGFILYASNLLPTRISVLSVNYATQIMTTLLIILIAYLIIQYLTKRKE